MFRKYLKRLGFGDFEVEEIVFGLQWYLFSWGICLLFIAIVLFCN